MYTTKEDVENWLNQMRIKNYVINEDLSVDVSSNVNISHKNLKQIPIQFRIINGSFNCSNNELTSLKGCPRIVYSYFICKTNNLTSLEGSPKEVNGHFNCDNNKINSFDFSPEKVKGRIFSFLHNNITVDKLVNFNTNIDLVEYIHCDFNIKTKDQFLNEVIKYKEINKENELLNNIVEISNKQKVKKL